MVKILDYFSPETLLARPTISLTHPLLSPPPPRSPDARMQHALFMLLDEDESGSLELEEVVAGAAVLGLLETEAEELFHELDADGNGSLDEEEFAQGFLSARLSFDTIRWPTEELYDSLDRSKTGEVTVEDFVAGAPILGITEEEARTLYFELDTDKNGAVSG